MKWISIKDQLPSKKDLKDNNKLLAYSAKNKDWEPSDKICSAGLSDDSEEPSCIFCNEHEWCGDHRDTITHWAIVTPPDSTVTK